MTVGIIVGTNRKDAFTKKIAQYYASSIQKQGHQTTIIDLENLPIDFAFTALYQNSGKNLEFATFQAQIDQSDRIVVIAPEYNGSFPGILKTFIDGLRHPDSLSNKKMCLVGLSAGVLGNAVGLGHLNDVLSYLNANVLGLRIKLGEVSKHFADGAFTNTTFASFTEKQINNFLTF
jgi:chromate reductase, NAD(P)H dehydrogenase (quinone)